MKNAILTFVLVAAAAACQPNLGPQAERSTQEGAIINGRTASQIEVGATVAILYRGGPSCSGTLIAPQVVLTAAHCVADLRSRDLEVVAGVIDSENAPNQNRHEVNRVVAHEDFRDFGGPEPTDPSGISEQNDIGLVILEAPITNIEPTPISIAVADAQLSQNDNVVISGFGTTSVNSGDVPDLQIATTRFIRRTPTELLAGGPADTCFGDSGGPVYLKINGERFVIGATSRGAHDAEAECGENGIYTFAPAYLPWIEQNAGGLFDASVDEGGQCAGQCGSLSEMNGACYCDAECVLNGDCCTGYQADCTEPETEEPENEEPENQEPENQEPENEEPETGTEETTSCYDSCGGLSSDGCWCDAACVSEGNCCDDYEEACPATEPETDSDIETEAPGQSANVASTGTWICDAERFVDDICDCGCGVTDPACDDATVDSCERVECNSGIVNGGDNARCITDPSAFHLKQACSQSGDGAPLFAIFALLLLCKRKLTKEP